MNKKILVALLLATPFFSVAQNANTTQPTNTSMAYGGTNTTRTYTRDAYNPEKKYTVLKIWHADEQLTEDEKKELASLKSQLARKNIEVLEYQWKAKEDLVNFLSKNNLNFNISTDDGLCFKGDKFQMSTTSKKVMLVVEDAKPMSICSGASCETNTKQFFNLITFN